MRFDPFSWLEVKPNEWHDTVSGQIEVRCSPEQAIFVRCMSEDGEICEALVGYGSRKVEIARPFSFVVSGKGRAFLRRRRDLVFEASGEVYTNLDRQPLESGSMLELQMMMRRFRLEQQAARDQLRAEHAALLAERADARAGHSADGTADAQLEGEQGDKAQSEGGGEASADEGAA